ncbi:hypothetical protein QR680_011779 [Steinernema hermaphroditum]|uniref:C-type lectin domain-containing protein n=1 Tax=Steinernema hermaphroditum TaxID=289476 RepID=A0AA39LZJ0_9BILA|nr:hypothetical protein QR680_011779 [Steinernema hermaphroditum]
MRRRLALFCLLGLSLVYAHIFVRSIPMGITLIATESHSGYFTSLDDCVKRWYFEPIKAVMYNNVTRWCYGSENLLGMEKTVGNPNERTYLLTRTSTNICNANATKEIVDIIAADLQGCHETWFPITVNGTTNCYYVMKDKEYTKYYTNTTEYVHACPKVRATATAAIITRKAAFAHNHLRNVMDRRLIIGMVPGSTPIAEHYNHPWCFKWMDGGNHFRKLNTNASSTNCTLNTRNYYAFLSQQLSGKMNVGILG